MVILSNISSTDIILEVNNDDDSATGTYSLIVVMSLSAIAIIITLWYNRRS